MTHRHLLGLVASLSVWFALAGGGGCEPPAESPTIASASVRTYSAPPWINATGVIWAPSYHATAPGVAITGAGERYIFAGGVDGPLPLSAVYECSSSGCAAGTSHHCPGGSSSTCGTCPTPCLEYHNNAVLAHTTTGRFSYRDVCGRDYGDGVSAKKPTSTTWSGEIEILRSHFANIHDDGAEHDGCRSMSIKDSMFDRAFIAFAMKPRLDDPQDCTGSTIELDKVLVRLHRFTNAFEQKPGTGGVFKLEDDNLPWFIVRESVFLIGPEVGEHQHVLPPPDRTDAASCEGNVILFSGSEEQRATWLADTDGADSRTNQQKLTALSYCYTLDAKPDSQTFGDFIYSKWLAPYSEWINAHQAGDGC